MTDTTAPDAITQADDDLAHEIMLRVRGHAVRLPQKGHWLKQALARHRRLAAHGAGEGLREAAQRTINDALMDSQYLAGVGAGWNAANADDPEAALAALQNSREGHLSSFAEAKRILATPPTVARSTTPPGGEGVPAGMKAYGPDHPDYPNPPRDQARLGLPVRRSGANAVGLDWRHHAPGHHRYPSDIVAYWPDAALLTPPTDAGSTTREGGEGVDWSEAANFVERYDLPDSAIAALATTSSPDASPDSGEGKQIIRQLRETGPKNFHNGTEWVGKPHNRDGEAAAQLIERLLAASPASLSGGEEERGRFEAWARQAGHPLRQTYEEYDDKLTHVAWCAWKAATVPSPEAPANRQEAGEVEREAIARATVMAMGLVAYITGLPEDLRWTPEFTRYVSGRADEIAAVRWPPTSPKDVKGEARG